jgi:hypothetical protein
LDLPKTSLLGLKVLTNSSIFSRKCPYLVEKCRSIPWHPHVPVSTKIEKLQTTSKGMEQNSFWGHFSGNNAL